MCSTSCPRSILLADASLSSTGSSGASSPASTVLSKRYGILPPSRRTSFPSLSDPFAMFQSDSGGTACVRPLRRSSVAPGMQKAKAPTKGLSELNSMAFELAVYASWSELPQYHAKLASSCWSGSTARDSHPQGSDERFQSCSGHLIPLSQALLGAIASTSAS